MNIKSLSAVALFVAAAFSAHAQTVVANDIIVGVRGSASVANLEIKAGSVSTLSGYTTETLIGNFNSALTSTIGGSWATATSPTLGGISWGAGGSSGTTSLVYGTSFWDKDTVANGGNGILGQAGNTLNGNTWNAIGNVAAGNTKFNSLNTGFNSVGAIATGDGKSRTFANGNANSWTSQGGTAAVAFGVFNPNNLGFSGNEGASIVAGMTYAAADLFAVGINQSDFLGTFALYQNGDLTFTAAIPEPSVYAAILGVATLGFAALRRRKQNQLVA